MLKKNTLFFLVLFNCFNVFSQKTVVRGKILDPDQRPLSFVNISYQHSQIGTISDIDGSFFFETTKATDTLIVSCLGYKVVNIPIKKGTEQYFEITLESGTVILDEVVITPGENPAFRILRNIDDRKKFNNPERFNSYQYKAYTKLRLDLNNIDENFKKQQLMKDFQFVFEYMDTSEVFGKNYLPLLISESVSKIYHQEFPPVEREVIDAFKMSGIENNTVSQFSGKMYQKLNIYDNFMKFFEPGFISPIAGFGKMYYKYYLEDSAFIDNNWCYKISFKPKRKQERTFYGFFWVNDTTWAVKSVQLRVSADVNLNLLKDMYATQEYKKLNDTTWFLSSEDLLIDFSVADKSYGFFGRKTARYDSIIINQPIPEEIKKLTTDTYYKDENLKRDTSFWKDNRSEVLTEEDQKVYKMVDTVQTLPMYKTLYKLSNMFLSYYYVAGPVEIGPYYTLYSSNFIEGSRVRIGGRTSNAFSTEIMFGGYVAYGFKDERYKYGANIDYMFSTNPRISIGAAFFHDMRQLGKSDNAFLDDNILTSILRRNPNYKLTMIDQYKIFFEREWFQGLSNTFSFKFNTMYPTQYIPLASVDNDGDTTYYGSLSSADISVLFHFAYHEKFLLGKFERASLGSKYPIFDFEIKFCPKGLLGSQYEYVNLRAQLSDKILTSPLGYFKYRITAGKIFGTLPYPLMELHEGNETYVFDPWAFNMMNYYEFVSDEYASIYAEQHFQGFILNRIPLIRKLEMREVVSAKVLYGRLSEKNKNVMIFPEGLTNLREPYYEASVGIENIFKVLRVDAMWRFNYLDHKNVYRFGIRVVVNFSF